MENEARAADQETPVETSPKVEGEESQEKGMFGDEISPTEAELMGEPEEKPQDKPEEKPGEKSPETPPEAAKPPEKTDTKPPEGFVPLAALQEERGKRQQLAQIVEDLQKTVEGMKPARDTAGDETAGEEDEFKILTKDEYAQLAEDDIVAAQVYLFELAEHEKKQADQVKTDEAASKLNDQIAQRNKEMEEAIPGIYDDDNPVNKDMTVFAVENGMDVDYLAALTNPGTRITLMDGSTFIMGRGAVGLAKMIHSTMTKARNGSTDAQALRETIKKEVAKEMLDKFQVSGEDAFRSIGDGPGVGEKPVVGGEITEDTFRKLSEEQQEALLRGAG